MADSTSSLPVSHVTGTTEFTVGEQREMYLTFGQRYYREPHEEGHAWVHPDGWLTVQYTVTGDGPRMCRERARVTAWHYLGGHYAFDYDEVGLDASFYPRGELARLVLP